MEQWSSRRNTIKDSLQPKDTQLEVLDLKRLLATDLREEDRAFIHTESGNRYMLRHSRSRGGHLVIYNEREGGFSAESAHLFLVKRGSSAIAEVGQRLQVFAITNETTGEGVPWMSTKVTRIEVRRNLEAAIRVRPEHAQETFGFQGIARALRSEAAPPARFGPKHQTEE